MIQFSSGKSCELCVLWFFWVFLVFCFFFNSTLLFFGWIFNYSIHSCDTWCLWPKVPNNWCICKCPVTVQLQCLNWPTAFCLLPVHCKYQVVSPWNESVTSYFWWSRLYRVAASQLCLLVTMNRRTQLHSCLKSVVNW